MAITSLGRRVHERIVNRTALGLGILVCVEQVMRVRVLLRGVLLFMNLRGGGGGGWLRGRGRRRGDRVAMAIAMKGGPPLLGRQLGHLLESLPGRDGAECTLHVFINNLKPVHVRRVHPAEPAR